MEETPDPDRFPDAANQALTPACTTIVESKESIAFPGRRIVETMSGLAQSNNGIGTVVESICADDYAPALNAIVDRIAAALRQLCLPRPLNRNSQDMVGCEVREVQPEGETCATAGRGREEVPVSMEDGREVCRVTQLPSDPTAGVPRWPRLVLRRLHGRNGHRVFVQSRGPTATRELHRWRRSDHGCADSL